ncbi:hypothetical protein Tsubulata_026878 [Turnera subulata]|uniref:Uncharacterized protein n=1 Tax=Turnera subulata TaxID=218843 RepID=A0A9Q0FIB5_9ROSI|nr:hypothetical protein Tsubulata_026878 [Turnera subulata]
MNIIVPSSSSSKTSFTLFSHSQNHNNNNNNITTTKFFFKFPTKPTPTRIPCSSVQSFPFTDRKPFPMEPQTTAEPKQQSIDSTKEKLVVRRPEMKDSGEGEGERTPSSSAPEIIDAGLEEFAKKMPIFEPARVESSASSSSSQGPPLGVNLDLALYKAGNLARKYKYKEAEKLLQKCISKWPEDGRAYVALGKILGKQSKWEECRALYDEGCQATQGENAYIWQCWAVLENKLGNIRSARELFDAATVADKGHRGAWHGWAVLELKQGNVKKARQLLAKALKFCGGNEYIYQTLAILEAKAKRFEQARSLFKQAVKYNPISCACWLAWAQVEMQQENNVTARKLFEQAIQVSPKNRYAWHVWGLFEEKLGNAEKGRKLLKIGHALNPKDPVLLQSLALLEYKHSTANLARALFRRASELDPRHQAVWFGWGWMEWKEGDLPVARKLYERVLSINTTSETAARCLQAWGVLEQRAGNLSAARRLFRSSLQVNSQSYVTWMTWAKLEEDEGNNARAEEIRNLYFQQRTEVVDDASWVLGFMNIIDPAIDSVKRFLNFGKSLYRKGQDASTNISEDNDNIGEDKSIFGNYSSTGTGSELDVDTFIKERLALDPKKLGVRLHSYKGPAPWRAKSQRKVTESENTTSTTLANGAKAISDE